MLRTLGVMKILTPLQKKIVEEHCKLRAATIRDDITQQTTAARIDERKRVEYEIEAFEKEVMKGRVSNIYHWFRETLLYSHRMRLAQLQQGAKLKEVK